MILTLIFNIENYKQLISILTQQMGACTTMNKKRFHQNYQVPQTQAKIGLLTIEILSGYIHSHSGLYLLEPEAKFKISNFEFSTKIPKESTKSTVSINTAKTVEKTNREGSVAYTVPINSLYKFHGRALQIQICQQPSKVQKYSGLGIMDLDPFLKQQCQNIETKCFINYDRKSGGYVNMLISFQEVQSELLLLRLDTIFMNSFKSQGKTLKARVTIGQEVLQTSQKTDSNNSTPSWKNQILMFKIPKPVTNGSIEILQKLDGKKTKLLGKIYLDIDNFSENDSRKIYKQEISLRGQIMGSVLFEIIQTLEHLEQITQTSGGKIFISNLNGKLTSLNQLPKNSFKDLPRTQTLIRNQLFNKSKAKTTNLCDNLSNRTFDLPNQNMPYITNVKRKSRKHSKRVSISDRLSQYMENCEKQNQHKQNGNKLSPSTNYVTMYKRQGFSESPKINNEQSWREEIRTSNFEH